MPPLTLRHASRTVTMGVDVLTVADIPNLHRRSSLVWMRISSRPRPREEEVRDKELLPYPIFKILLLGRRWKRNQCVRCVRISEVMPRLWLIMLLRTLVNEARSARHSIYDHI